jgi:hypothetical protein
MDMMKSGTLVKHDQLPFELLKDRSQIQFAWKESAESERLKLMILRTMSIVSTC